MSWSDPVFWRGAATLFFFLFFLGATAWALLSRSARGFDRDAALPLDDGDRHE